MGPWVVAQIYKGSELAFSGINHNQRLGLSPFAGVATGLLKTPRTQLENTGRNDTVPIPILNTFQITTFTHLYYRRKMTDYSFYSCIRYRNATTRQSVCRTSRLSVKMQIVLSNRKIKYSNLVLPMQIQQDS